MATVEQATNQLEALGRRFKEAGDRELKKQLLAGIRATNKPTIAAIRASARETLPKRGGLAERVASSSIGTRTRLSGQNVGVEIRGTGRSVRNITSINAGRLRHPVFGNRKVFVQQRVREGFFDTPVEHDLPRIREGIDHAMSEVAHHIEKGL